jgi:hypothetical protein
MKKFEYKIIDSSDIEKPGFFKGRKRADIEQYLNELGSEGWEIINMDFRELEARLEFSGVAKREVDQ